MTFENLNLIEPILKALQEEGYSTPTPIQEKSIPILLQGKDLLGCAQTGTGKTAAFSIPILQKLYKTDNRKSIKALILTPTRELAIQIGECFSAYGKYTGLRHAVIFGGVGQKPQTDELKRGVQILVATPGRLQDLVNQGFINLKALEFFVLDEADRMLDMGFIHDVTRLLDRMDKRKNLGLFSATISREVMDIAWVYQRDAEEVTVREDEQNKPDIKQFRMDVSVDGKAEAIAKILNETGFDRCMVFCNTKGSTERITKFLQMRGIDAQCIHGDIPQKKREQVMDLFRKGKLRVFVSTDVAARGIDVSDVDAVINYDVPGDNEHYTHRIGRTGRAKKEGVSYLFYVPEEKKRVQELLRLTRNTDLCTPVHFDFNHEHIVVEEKKDNADRFQIKCYF